jgi:hypothetical protein
METEILFGNILLSLTRISHKDRRNENRNSIWEYFVKRPNYNILLTIHRNKNVSGKVAYLEGDLRPICFDHFDKSV